MRGHGDCRPPRAPPARYQRELAHQEAVAEGCTLAVVPRFEPAVPAPAQVWAAVSTVPLGAREAGNGLLLDGFVSKWAEADQERVTSAIRRGAFEGRSVDQIVQDIRGTRGRGFQDVVIATSRNAAQTAVRTAVQHVATVARMETLQANDDILDGYARSSTLDGRASSGCASLDGQVFKFGKGPMPPAHPNCRSSIIPQLRPE